MADTVTEMIPALNFDVFDDQHPRNQQAQYFQYKQHSMASHHSQNQHQPLSCSYQQRPAPYAPHQQRAFYIKQQVHPDAPHFHLEESSVFDDFYSSNEYQSNSSGSTVDSLATDDFYWSNDSDNSDNLFFETEFLDKNLLNPATGNCMVPEFPVHHHEPRHNPEEPFLFRTEPHHGASMAHYGLLHHQMLHQSPVTKRTTKSPYGVPVKPPRKRKATTTKTKKGASVTTKKSTKKRARITVSVPSGPSTAQNVITPPPSKKKSASINPSSKPKQTSSFRGVSCCGKDRKWQARIRDANRVRYLGRFQTEVEAALVYDEAARECKGAEAPTNFLVLDESTTRRIKEGWVKNKCLPMEFVKYLASGVKAKTTDGLILSPNQPAEPSQAKSSQAKPALPIALHPAKKFSPSGSQISSKPVNAHMRDIFCKNSLKKRSFKHDGVVAEVR